MRRFFFTSSGGLRGVWRIVIFFAASVAAFIVLQGAAAPFLVAAVGIADARGMAAQSWILALALVVGTAVAVRYVDKRPWSDVWLGSDAARPAAVVSGFAVGAFAIGLPTAMLVVAGWERNVGAPPGSWGAAAMRLSVTLVPAALLEELMTRGYVLRVLQARFGWFWSIGATSVVFGLLHLDNPGADVRSVTLVTLAGFFLAAVLYATRSLYAAWAAHFAWNWTMAAVFHVAVSGLPMESPGYRYVDAGPTWATGGTWGPEGGVPAAFGMLAGITLLLSRRLVREQPPADDDRTPAKNHET